MIRARLSLGVLLLSAAVYAQPFDPSLFSGLRWRLAGPFRGGRALSAAGVPGDPSRFYFGAVGGGVWRSDNAGRTWEPIFDGQPVASIGAVAVAPSRPEVIYAGTGEADMRSDISSGDGLYKSTDGGGSWMRIGLEDSSQIGRILLDPADPGRVFVAVLGHAYGPSAERGLFRTTDGGRTWSRVLFKNVDTGAIDVASHPGNPRTILAALWQTRRPPWNVYPPSSGPGSGLYRSTDGGDTWRRITDRGLPVEGVGRIGVAFAPADPRIAYALVDAKDGGLFVSSDAGASWTRASSDSRIWQRGWYFAGVTVDPRDAQTVYVCNTALYRSSDGGKTFVPVKGSPGGDDYHQLWIDPAEPRRMIVASDQGAVVSLDGGKTWSSWYNQPTAQLYHVSVDGEFPYRIYGAQQDTGAVEVSSRSEDPRFRSHEWRPIASGGENGYIVPDPREPRFLFGGGMGRFDRETLQERDLDPTIEHPGVYRSTWTLPLAVSPFDSRTLYFSHQVLFRTTDGGESWKTISPDLTREDPGVPPNLDASAAENDGREGLRRGVVYSIAPSPRDPGLLWCGTDDGLIWKSPDGGGAWENVTPRGLAAWSKIGVIEASRFDPQTAYAAVDRHRLDDSAPYIYRTRDGGKSWVLAAGNLPSGSHVNVVREDPARRGLLYAGTESGVFVSFDGGDQWQPLKLNLPACSVRDIAIRGDDLVIATHGRSFWVLDDITPLRQMEGRVASSPVWLFAPAAAVRLHPAPFQGTPEPRDEPAGENPPAGAILDYALAAPAAVVLEILDSRGEIVRRYATEDRPDLPDLQKIEITPDWVPVLQPPGGSAGTHRVVWDLRYAAPPELKSPASGSKDPGLRAPPGGYTVRLTAAGHTLTQPLVLLRDPRLRASDADLTRQFELAREIEEERRRAAVCLRQAQALREQIAPLRDKTKTAGQAAAAAEAFAARLEEVAGKAGPVGWEESRMGSENPASLRILSTMFARLADSVESADSAPTPGEISAHRRLRSALERLMARWNNLLESDLARTNAALATAGLPPLRVD